MKKFLSVLLSFIAAQAFAIDRLIPAGTSIAITQSIIDAAQPDDNVKFQRGGTWVGNLVMTQSGTAGHPITYTNYGTGALPILTTMQPYGGTWTSVGTNKWRSSSTSVSSIVVRLWLNGAEAVRRENVASLAAVGDMYNNHELEQAIYVYAPSNPATYFSSITWTAGLANAAFNSNAKNYWVVDALDIQGGRNLCFDINSSSHWQVINCNIGANTNRNGLGTWLYCEDGLVQYNTFDSKFRQLWNYEVSTDYKILGDPVYMSNGAHNIRVLNNTMRAFMHSGINLEPYYQVGAEYTATTKTILGTAYAMSDIRVEGNYINGDDVSYFRGFGATTPVGRPCYNVKFLNNRIKGCPIHSQVSMPNIEVAYNVFSDNIRTAAHPNSLGDFGGITLNGSDQGVYTDMSIHNNTFYHLADPAIRLKWSSPGFYGTGTITATGTTIVTGSGTSFLSTVQVGDYIANSTTITAFGRVASIQSNTQLTLTAVASFTMPAGSSYYVLRPYSQFARNKIYNNLVVDCGYNPSVSALANCGILFENFADENMPGATAGTWVHDNEIRNNIVYNAGFTATYYDSRIAGTSKYTPTAYATAFNGRQGDVISNNDNTNPVLSNVGAGQYWITAASTTFCKTGGYILGTATGLLPATTWPSSITTGTQDGAGWTIGAYLLSPDGTGGEGGGGPISETGGSIRIRGKRARFVN